MAPTETSTTTALTLVCITIVSISISLCRAADLICEGTEECQGVDIGIGTPPEYQNVICSGIASCYDADIYVVCEDKDCKLECSNTASCTDLFFTFDGSVKEVICKEFAACYSASLYIEATDDFELKCEGSSSCQEMRLLPGTDARQGAKYSCHGSHACHDFSFTVPVYGTKEMSCIGQYACNSAYGLHFNPMPSFALKCEEDHACQDMSISLAFMADSTTAEVKEIKCDGNEACHGLTVTLVNMLSETAVIEELKCEGFAACKDLVLLPVVGDWRINKCICDDPSPYSCLCAAGLEICDEIIGVWNQDGTDALPCSISST